MLSTGNVQNHLRKLQTELRSIKFRNADYKSLQTGNPCEFLKIYHYIFVDFNPLLAKTLLDKCQADFYGKTDSHFIDTMYKTLRDYFNYKPPITKEQFFSSSNFAEKKLQMACDILILVREECQTINAKQNQPKRMGSSSARVSLPLISGEKEKKQIATNLFHPLHDMDLETTTIEDQFVSMEQQVQPEEQAKLRATINHLEEQIQLLKTKIEDINERLNKIISILQDTHLGNNGIASSDLINLNARLVMLENELALLTNKSSSNHEINSEQKQTIIPQGILIDDDNHSDGYDL